MYKKKENDNKERDIIQMDSNMNAFVKQTNSYV